MLTRESLLKTNEIPLVPNDALLVQYSSYNKNIIFQFENSQTTSFHASSEF